MRHRYLRKRRVTIRILKNFKPLGSSQSAAEKDEAKKIKNCKSAHAFIVGRKALSFKTECLLRRQRALV